MNVGLLSHYQPKVGEKEKKNKVRLTQTGLKKDILKQIHSFINIAQEKHFYKKNALVISRSEKG